MKFLAIPHASVIHLASTATRQRSLKLEEHALPRRTLSPNRLKHRAAFGKIGRALTTLEIEWRVARGESPNPWHGIESDSAQPNSKYQHAPMRVMQIDTSNRKSKLQRRSEEYPDE